MGFLVFLGQGLILFSAQGKNAGGTKDFPWRAALFSLLGLAFLGGVWVFRNEWSRLWIVEPDRWAWWRSALRMWLDNPWWGVGPGAFGEAYPGYRADPWGQNSLYAHNMILEMLAERGILGTGAFLWFFLFLGLRTTKARKLSVPLIGLVGFLVFNLVHVGFSFPSLAWSFWALSGYLWGEMRQGEEEVQPIGAPRRLWALGHLLLWAGVGVFSYRLFQADRCLAQARIAWAGRDIRRADALIEEGLRWNPREPELYSLRAALDGAGRRWEKARESIAQSIRLAPYSARFQQEAGEIALQKGSTEEALACYTKAVRRLPLNPLLWLRRAQILESRQEFAAAARDYGTALWLVEKKGVQLDERGNGLLLLARERWEKWRSLAPEAEAPRLP
jgi:hypothetical protein